MLVTNRKAVSALHHLYRILDAGEHGYAVAAANVENRALKLLFSSYAAQRADFKVELAKRIRELGEEKHGLIDLFAMIHRGRMHIFAALTIGEEDRERVVAREALVGEQAALRSYEGALRMDLPPGISQVAEEQYKVIRASAEKVELLRGKDGRRLVIRLFDSHRAAARAVQALKRVGFDEADIESLPIRKEMKSNGGVRQNTLLETVLSGMAGGALWGSLSGALAGLGVLHLPGLGLENAPLGVQQFAWAVTALGAIASGGMVGGMLGLFIGWGIRGEDAYGYSESQERGQVTVSLVTNEGRAAQASQILSQVIQEGHTAGRRALA